MTAQELDERLQPIKDYRQRCDEANEALQKLAGDSFICVDIGDKLLDAYVAALSRELGDNSKDTWLSWFIWENDFGARGHECTVKGKEYIVKNTADLLEVIEAWKKAQPKS